MVVTPLILITIRYNIGIITDSDLIAGATVKRGREIGRSEGRKELRKTK